jgi:hypothetical protein
LSAAETTTKKSWHPKKRHHTGERIRNAFFDAVPAPFAASALLQRDARAPLGYRFSVKGERIFRQVLRTIGLEASPDKRPTKTLREHRTTGQRAHLSF